MDRSFCEGIAAGLRSLDFDADVQPRLRESGNPMSAWAVVVGYDEETIGVLCFTSDALAFLEEARENAEAQLS